MSNARTLTVTTEIGTFTRQTARAYAFVVIGRNLPGGIVGANLEPAALGWCTRLDLARRLAASNAHPAREVWIYSVTTGERA